MTEFTAQQIKDVQMMNATSVLKDLLSAISEIVMHVGDHINEDMEAYKEGIANPETTDLERVSLEAELSEKRHMRKGMTLAMDGLAKAIEVTRMADKLVALTSKDISIVDALELSAVIADTDFIKDLQMVMKETPKEGLARLTAEKGIDSIIEGLVEMLAGKANGR